MAHEPTTPDRVDIVRRADEAWNRRDVDAWLNFCVADIVRRPTPP